MIDLQPCLVVSVEILTRHSKAPGPHVQTTYLDSVDRFKQENLETSLCPTTVIPTDLAPVLAITPTIIIHTLCKSGLRAGGSVYVRIVQDKDGILA